MHLLIVRHGKSPNRVLLECRGPGGRRQFEEPREPLARSRMKPDSEIEVFPRRDSRSTIEVTDANVKPAVRFFLVRNMDAFTALSPSMKR